MHKKQILLSVAFLMMSAVSMNIISTDNEQNNLNKQNNVEDIKKGFLAIGNVLHKHAVTPMYNGLAAVFESGRKGYGNYIYPNLPKFMQGENHELNHVSSEQNTTLSSNQKIALGIIALSITAAAIAYYQGCFASFNVLPSDLEIQNMIQEVVADKSIPQDEKLNRIFDVLTQHGLGNFVVYSSTMFDVEHIFRVEIIDDKVSVTRCI